MRCCARMRRVGQGSSECWPTSGTLGASRQRRGLRPAAPGAGAAAAAAADRPARLDHRPAQGPEPRHARGGAGGAGRPRIPGRRRRPGQPGQVQPALQRVLRRSLELPAHHGSRPLRPPCRPPFARCCGAPRMPRRPRKRGGLVNFMFRHVLGCHGIALQPTPAPGGGVRAFVRSRSLVWLGGARPDASAARQGVPTNELHACGYISIGCEPCTRAVLPNQHEREGRWWWEARARPPAAAARACV